MNPNPQQPYAPNQQQPSQRRFSSGQLTIIIVVAIIFGSCALCAILGGISNYLNPNQNSNMSANVSAPSSSPVAASNENASTNGQGAYKYFEGSRACQYMASVKGLELGPYEKRKVAEGYSCSGGERKINLSCNPTASDLCDEVAYSASGEEKGATHAELAYMGLSLRPETNKKDIQTFIEHANQLARQALGQEMSAEMKQHILKTDGFLPIKPEPSDEELERHTLKKSLGTGFVKILTRKNDLPGGTAYMIFFTVYPDEHWVTR
jgi:hypothetical protein